MATILYADADTYLTDLLTYALTREGYTVHPVASGAEVLPTVRAEAVDLVMLDLDLPDQEALAVLAALRSFSTIPVLLTGRAAEEIIVRGFGLGADDHVTKPFSLAVLLLRVRNLLRRSSPAPSAAPLPPSALFALEGCVFDSERHAVRAGTTHLPLTPTESQLLRELCLHAGHPLPAEHLLERVRGYDTESAVAVIRTHIGHLRAKLARLPTRPRPIRTVRGRGYLVAKATRTLPLMG